MLIKLFFLFCFTPFFLSCQRDPSPSSQILLGKDGLFQNVLDLIHAHTIHPIALETIVSGAMNGALHTVDEFSEYYSAHDFEKMHTLLMGEFGGIGVEGKLTQEGFEVIAPIDQSPAATCGILSGDIITAVNGQPLRHITPLEVFEKIHGKPGTPINISVYRKKMGMMHYDLMRALIKNAPAKGMLENRIAYLRFSFFNQQSVESITKEIASLRMQLHEKYGSTANFQGAILDVRNNPGGTLDQAVAVTSLFLEKGPIVHVHGKHESQFKTFYSSGPDLLKGCPIVILINNGSASASEVLAGALRDHKRAILLGEKTYGKGSVQRIFDMHDRGAIKLTVAYFKTPLSQHKIQGQGLEPDILVLESPHKVHDELQIHKKSGSLSVKNDDQKQRALDLLQGMSALNLHAIPLQEQEGPS